MGFNFCGQAIHGLRSFRSHSSDSPTLDHPWPSVGSFALVSHCHCERSEAIVIQVPYQRLPRRYAPRRDNVKFVIARSSATKQSQS